MVLTMQCCLTVNSIGPHAIASFLDRCLLEMDMALSQSSVSSPSHLSSFFTHRLTLFCVSLCHVISGILAGGSLVSAWYFVASLTRWYGLVVWLFLVCLLLCHTN